MLEEQQPKQTSEETRVSSRPKRPLQKLKQEPEFWLAYLIMRVHNKNSESLFMSTHNEDSG